MEKSDFVIGNKNIVRIIVEDTPDYVLECSENTKFLNMGKWYLYLSQNMEQIILELVLHLPNDKKIANLATS